MRRRIAVASCVAIAAACAACEKSSKEKERKRTDQDVDKGAAVLFTSPDERARPTLFQWKPGDEAASAVAVEPEGAVYSAASSREGAAVAAIVLTADGTPRLWRAAGDERGAIDVALPAMRPWVWSLSSDGDTIALTDDSGDGDLTIVSIDDGRARTRTVAASKLGKLMYRVVLSDDGGRLAFSTMDAACARDATAMQTCPVRLWGLELGDDDSEPHALASFDGAASYDPAFADPRGDQVLYMTSRHDASAPCQESVNQCRYTIERVRFGGGAPEIAVRGAIHARVAPDGALSYRRRSTWDDRLTWSDQALVVADGDDETTVHETLGSSYSLWDPSGRRIAAVLGGDARGPAVLERDGALRRIPGASYEAVLRGWVAEPLPTAPRKPGPSRDVAMLTRAVELARPHAGRLAADLLVVADDHVYQQLADPPPRAGDIPAVVEAMLAGPTVAVARTPSYCQAVSHLSARDESPHAIELAGDYVVFTNSGPDAALDPPPSDADDDVEALARFSDVGGGTVDLVSVELPERVAAGDSFRARLAWRVHRPPSLNWSVFVHFDRGPFRFRADHAPAICARWIDRATPGRVVEDAFGVRAAHELTGIAPGEYEVFVGWSSYTQRARAESDKLRVVGGNTVRAGTIRVTE